MERKARDRRKALRALIERSGQMQNRLRHLDNAIYGEKTQTPANADNPVAAQLNLIKGAFGPKD